MGENSDFKDYAVSKGDVITDMEAFNKKYGFDKIPPELLTAEFFKFRLNFLVEELNEAIKAYNEGNAAEFVDGLIDLIVVSVGTLQFGEVDVRKAWALVHLKNMQKTRGSNSKREGSGGIDLIKPEGWTPPDHSDNIGTLNRTFQGSKFRFFVNPVKHLENRILNSNQEGLKRLSEKIGNDEPNPNIDVLIECAELMVGKSSDYNSSKDVVQMADYFPEGVSSIFSMVHHKYLRAKSIIWKMKGTEAIHFESLEDTFKDLINYSAFAVSWIRNKIQGQRPNSGVFNEN